MQPLGDTSLPLRSSKGQGGAGPGSPQRAARGAGEQGGVVQERGLLLPPQQQAPLQSDLRGVWSHRSLSPPGAPATWAEGRACSSRGQKQYGGNIRPDTGERPFVQFPEEVSLEERELPSCWRCSEAGQGADTKTHQRAAHGRQLVGQAAGVLIKPLKQTEQEARCSEAPQRSGTHTAGAW